MRWIYNMKPVKFYYCRLVREIKTKGAARSVVRIPVIKTKGAARSVVCIPVIKTKGVARSV